MTLVAVWLSMDALAEAGTNVQWTVLLLPATVTPSTGHCLSSIQCLFIVIVQYTPYLGVKNMPKDWGSSLGVELLLSIHDTLDSDASTIHKYVYTGSKANPCSPNWKENGDSRIVSSNTTLTREWVQGQPAWIARVEPSSSSEGPRFNPSTTQTRSTLCVSVTFSSFPPASSFSFHIYFWCLFRNLS